MRPWSIIAFEWLYISTLAMGVSHAIAAWEANIAFTSPAFVLTVQTLAFSLTLALVLWVSLGRSNVAKWINLVPFVLGLPGIAMLYGREVLTGWNVVGLVQALLQAIALSLLFFTPSARAWLAGRVSPPAALKKTFD